jgi:hypothetical protein
MERLEISPRSLEAKYPQIPAQSVFAPRLVPFVGSTEAANEVVARFDMIDV